MAKDCVTCGWLLFVAARQPAFVLPTSMTGMLWLPSSSCWQCVQMIAHLYPRRLCESLAENGHARVCCKQPTR